MTRISVLLAQPTRKGKDGRRHNGVRGRTAEMEIEWQSANGTKKILGGRTAHSEKND
jgi:hypothetical protein